MCANEIGRNEQGAEEIGPHAFRREAMHGSALQEAYVLCRKLNP